MGASALTFMLAFRVADGARSERRRLDVHIAVFVV
jgi:hypothetical protein